MSDLSLDVAQKIQLRNAVLKDQLDNLEAENTSLKKDLKTKDERITELEGQVERLAYYDSPIIITRAYGMVQISKPTRKKMSLLVLVDGKSVTEALNKFCEKYGDPAKGGDGK